MDHAWLGVRSVRRRPHGVLSLNATAPCAAPTGPASSYGEALRTLAQETAAADGALAVLLISVGDVSRLQSRLGFAESEALLQSLHASWSESLGTRGAVLRISDGSFCAVVRAIRNNGHAVLAGEKLLRVTEEKLNVAGFSLHVGVSMCPAQASDAATLLRNAQLAAEAARKRRTRVVVYDATCSADVLETWALGSAYAQALESGALSVFYQPKISMASGHPVGVESLLRWFKDGKPVASPDVFIPLAEEAGLIQPTTWYSLSNSMRLSAECAGLSVAVNVTPLMLHAREFIDMVRTAISMWGIKDNQLTLEITEGGLIADFNQATTRLKQLRDLGLRVSIDDFGTGYSSLSYFKKIPANELKIDKSFVMNMVTDMADERLVQTIVGLAHHFKLEIVAEGVENHATFEALRALGCHQAQGYLFSPALSREGIIDWLARNSRDLRSPAAT